MSKTVTIAISLPQEIVEAVESARAARSETRDEFFRTAVETLLRSEREAVERYIQGYRATPETDDEVAAARQAGAAILAQEPWD